MLGVTTSATVLCDGFFVRWFCRQEVDPRFRLSHLLKVDDIKLVTTRCVHRSENAWYEKQHQTLKLMVKVKNFRNLPSVCSHDVHHTASQKQMIQDAQSCLEAVLMEKGKYNKYYLATSKKEDFKKVQKIVPIPILTLKDGSLILLPPTLAIKKLFQKAKDQRIQTREDNRQALCAWEEEEDRREEQKELDNEILHDADGVGLVEKEMFEAANEMNPAGRSRKKRRLNIIFKSFLLLTSVIQKNRRIKKRLSRCGGGSC